MSTPGNSSVNSVLFLSHGGGPLPLLDDPAHAEMVASLRHIAAERVTPSAILVISAHWEQGKATITSATHPALIYDYSGFPEASYSIQYPAAGHPVLAQEIFNTLTANGINAMLDENRGFDHGMFVPLKIMYPDAAIPCVQLSLLKNLNPAEHINIGKALSGLAQQNLLVIGSGFSFHNLRAFFAPTTNETQTMNESFEQWLIETCCSMTLNEIEREHRLINWEAAPAARFCHPREEHLLPLHVCYGFAHKAATKVFRFSVLGKQASAYLW